MTKLSLEARTYLGILCIGIGALLFFSFREFFPEIMNPLASSEIVSPTLLSFDLSASSTFVAEAATSTVGVVGARIRIPKIGVDMPIVLGEKSEKIALRKGAWLIPGTAEPWNDTGYHNTVISAHRYLYTSGPRTFFRLDEVAQGDEIIISTSDGERRYRVFETKVLEPDAVWILNKTEKPTLTLFTCTPKFTTKQRLVVFAEPIAL